MTTLRSLALCTTLLAALAGCSDSTTPGVDGPHPLNPEAGKSDNYISTNAREFVLTGHALATAPSDLATLEGDARDAALTRAAEGRLPAVVRAIKQHIEGVVSGLNGDKRGDDAEWFVYVRRDASNLADVAIVDDNGTPKVQFGFELELVGNVTLMSKLSPEDGGGDRTFEVVVKDYWADTDGEHVTVTMAGSESRDAFPRYDAMFADGVLRVAIHFGGDYNSERFDLDTARWLVGVLLEQGFTNTAVTGFDDLKLDSPPFTRSLTVEGRPLEVQVKVVHSDMVPATEESLLSDSFKQSLLDADIIVYSGHAGENAGFILDYQPRLEIRPSEIATLPMSDGYQIFFLDGCQTYRTYVDDLLANPHRSSANTDIVTTINTTPFSVGYQVLWEVLFWMTLTDDDGDHFPLSWKTILRGINTEQFDSVHYGVHGVDDDPQLNPHHSEGVACTPCATDADCAAGGNLCLGYPGGGRCGVACTTDTACGEGYRCARITDDEDLFYIPKQCVRRDLSCAAP
ncbi:MAG: hypothetical protein EP329_01950 [Deltaproteobacteria bacterium]|nr:MAG: hypothetical protein EP329_01950 [Deltaproteobacteria bacterium]